LLAQRLPSPVANRLPLLSAAAEVTASGGTPIFCASSASAARSGSGAGWVSTTAVSPLPAPPAGASAGVSSGGPSRSSPKGTSA